MKTEIVEILSKKGRTRRIRGGLFAAAFSDALRNFSKERKLFIWKKRKRRN